MITKYAVKDVGTGEYLPEPQGRMGRGGSHIEPCLPVDGQPTTYPRLFYTVTGARNALAQWRRGKHHSVYDYDEDCIGRTIKVDAGTSIEVVPSRFERDMQIVPINIEV